MGEKKMIKAALLGAGTVGSGVYALSEMLKDEMFQKTGANLEIKKVLVRNTKKERPGIPKEVLTDNWKEILEDDEIQLVIELMGGVEPARTYIVEALETGKQVVTANKDVLAEYGQEILTLAENNGCDIQFEAAVAGAIPIIRPLKQSLAGSMLTEIMGIVNGTTNYILTKMSEEGMDYQEALAKAMELGYAEADPTADVEGYDAGRKIAIMSSLAFNSKVTFKDVYMEGITKITSDDIRYAKEFDSFNAVFVHGEACDDAMFMGRGAGKMPTASAVMGDIIIVMRNIVHDNCGWNGGVAYKNYPVKPIEETRSRYFLRLQVANKPGALANIAGVLGNNDVSIAQVVQKRARDGVAELVVITDSVLERHFNDALMIVKGMSVLREVSGIIRVYGD